MNKYRKRKVIFMLGESIILLLSLYLGLIVIFPPILHLTDSTASYFMLEIILALFFSYLGAAVPLTLGWFMLYQKVK